MRIVENAAVIDRGMRLPASTSIFPFIGPNDPFTTTDEDGDEFRLGSVDIDVHGIIGFDFYFEDAWQLTSVDADQLALALQKAAEIARSRPPHDAKKVRRS